MKICNGMHGSKKSFLRTFAFVYQCGKLVCVCIDFDNLQCGEIRSGEFVRGKKKKSHVKKERDEKNSGTFFYCCVFAPPGGFC